MTAPAHGPATVRHPTGPTPPLLDVDGLTVHFRLRDAVVHAVTNAHLALHSGQLLAVVGESGCGKSALAHALLGLLPRNTTITGHARLRLPDGTSHDLLAADPRTLARRIRGQLVGLVPQSPATALTPVRTGRSLLAETLRVHVTDLTRADTRPRADDLAAAVGLAPDDLDRYPHELSGGMAQRLVTALALAPDPPVLLADEPTTGLDRPLVDATLDLLRARCDAGGAVLLITHDLPAARRVADTVAVMYASRIIETAPTAQVFTTPRHPYTAGLLDAQPDRAFTPVPGHPPQLTRLPAGCAFAPRCPRTDPACLAQPPTLTTGDGSLACHHPLGPPPQDPR